MRTISKKNSKKFNVSIMILEIAFEIILFPFHILAGIRNVIKEIRR